MKKFIKLLMMLFISAGIASCEDDNDSTSPKTFVLVAGAWQGAVTYVLKSGHSPHLSAPDELTNLIVRIAFL